MKLILIRHGRPDENSSSPNDPPLDAEGLGQALAAAACLADEGVTRIVASPLRRARQTAAPLAERLGLNVDIVEGWSEADGTRDRYRSLESLRAEGGEGWARFVADPIRALGADPEIFKAQLIRTLRETADSSATVAVFTHGLPINLSLSHALGLEGAINFLVGYGSLTRLRKRDNGRFAVGSVNETAHQKVMKRA